MDKTKAGYIIAGHQHAIHSSFSNMIYISVPIMLSMNYYYFYMYVCVYYYFECRPKVKWVCYKTKRNTYYSTRQLYDKYKLMEKWLI